jgi:hypothetical protein
VPQRSIELREIGVLLRVSEPVTERVATDNRVQQTTDVLRRLLLFAI